ncbi:conserved hypothetical protein [Ricinus communis]|uniref:Uncharacterized protein n=1 Tax=Ricinus communis TaxID=3988 RepID=B9RQ99_RICCO|nr:conserved hypothetical protein [Ricinus communis]
MALPKLGAQVPNWIKGLIARGQAVPSKFTELLGDQVYMRNYSIFEGLRWNSRHYLRGTCGGVSWATGCLP